MRLSQRKKGTFVLGHQTANAFEAILLLCMPFSVFDTLIRTIITGILIIYRKAFCFQSFNACFPDEQICAGYYTRIPLQLLFKNPYPTYFKTPVLSKSITGTRLPRKVRCLFRVFDSCRPKNFYPFSKEQKLIFYIYNAFFNSSKLFYTKQQFPHSVTHSFLLSPKQCTHMEKKQEQRTPAKLLRNKA